MKVCIVGFATKMQDLCEDEKIAGFPALKLYKDGKFIGEYDSLHENVQLTVSKFMKFANKYADEYNKDKKTPVASVDTKVNNLQQNIDELNQKSRELIVPATKVNEKGDVVELKSKTFVKVNIFSILMTNF